MAIVALTHNNKNQYRKYPFKQEASLKAVQGRVLSDATIVNMSITSTYGMHKLYVKQVFYKDSTITITLASVVDDTAIGAFYGDITEDFTTLTLTPFVRFVSGNITLGSLNALQTITTVLNFTANNAELEESTIFCYKVPGVTSINDSRKNQIRGNVNFGNLTNLSKSTATGKTLFSVDNTESIENIADRTSYFGNCINPIIKTINGVYPMGSAEYTSTENDGNIYLVGVKPIVFYGTPGQDDTMSPGSVKIDAEDITISTLCAEKYKAIPPVDISGVTTQEGKNMYFNKTDLLRNAQSAVYPHTILSRVTSNVFDVKLPEYYYWPQFVKPEYYEDWRLMAPSAPTILSVTSSSYGAVVYFKPPKNSGIANIISYTYSTDDGFTATDTRTITGLGSTDHFTIARLLQPDTEYDLILRANNSNLLSGFGEPTKVFKFRTLTI